MNADAARLRIVFLLAAAIVLPLAAVAAFFSVAPAAAQQAPGKPGTPVLTRTEFSGQSAPALDVTWAAPTDNPGAVTGYRIIYRKKAADGQDPDPWS